MDFICINHLSKTFGKNQVLDDISLTVKSGEIFCYLGPNGAGKMTTLRILLTFSRTSNTSNPDKNRHGHPPQYANAPGLHT
jgi:ABC-type multidrug transport system ATPase subunit